MNCMVCDGVSVEDGPQWTVCDKCFRADRFDGFAHWTPMFCALAFLIAVAFFVAAMMELAQ